MLPGRGRSLHQRDCSSACWAPSSCQTLYLAQSLQSCILPKMTASLQLTDTDFRKRFKVFGRSAMGDLRQSGQEALLKSGSREVWIASHEDCLKAVVTAH